MLDNLAPAELHALASTLKKRYPHVLLEASGGITRATVASYFHPSVDIISMGSITQGVQTVDFSLKILKNE